VSGRAVDLDTRDVTFMSGDVALHGRLVLPKGTGRVPIIVLGHGSENTSAVGYAWTQRVFPAAGVGVFVFDKRGTGKSGGAYTQNFSALADDVVAAVAGRVAAEHGAGREAGHPAPASQWLHQMCSSMNAESCERLRAPIFVATGLPSLNSISVGRLRTWYCVRTFGFSSAFTFAILTWPA
jgi:uncharacterized protein